MACAWDLSSLMMPAMEENSPRSWNKTWLTSSLCVRRASEHSNGSAKQPSSSREALQRRIDELSAALVEAERTVQALKKERDEHKIQAASASVSELEAHKSRSELARDKEALHDALQVNIPF